MLIRLRLIDIDSTHIHCLDELICYDVDDDIINKNKYTSRSMRRKPKANESVLNSSIELLLNHKKYCPTTNDVFNEIMTSNAGKTHTCVDNISCDIDAKLQEKFCNDNTTSDLSLCKAGH